DRGKPGRTRREPVAGMAKGDQQDSGKQQALSVASACQRKRMVTRVAFNMDRQGKVASPPHIVASSGMPAFDQEALELIERAQPYPPPPAVLPGAEVLVIVPIWFDPPR